MPAALASKTPVKCCDEPAGAPKKFTRLGVALHHATKSRSVLTFGGTAGPIESAITPRCVIAIGSKSVSVS
jgi:hypothetical protein